MGSLKQTRDQVQVSTTTVQWGHYKVQVPGVNNISDNTRCHQQDQGSGTSVQCQKQWGHHVGITTTTSSSLPDDPKITVNLSIETVSTPDAW